MDEIPPSPRRRQVRRRRRRSREQKRQPWLLSGLALIVVVLALSAWGIARMSGMRGPRWLESWPPARRDFEPWRVLEAGIEYSRTRLDSPRALRCHALRIDLGGGGFELVMPRGAEAGNGATQVEWPLSWLRGFDLLAAINATPFNPAPILPGRATQLQGLAISDGVEWSLPTGNLDNVVVSPEGWVRLMQARMPVGDSRFGAGGFLIIRRGGHNLGESGVPDAVTALGLSEDRRWLYFLVVDGGQPGYSEGITAREASDLMGGLGASDAIRMDGGASSVLAVAAGSGGARVLNRPRNPLYDGAPRPVGNVLGVRRKPASASPRSDPPPAESTEPGI